MQAKNYPPFGVFLNTSLHSIPLCHYSLQHGFSGRRGAGQEGLGVQTPPSHGQRPVRSTQIQGENLTVTLSPYKASQVMLPSFWHHMWLIKYFANGFNCNVSATSGAFASSPPPGALPGLCTWTTLGDFHSSDRPLPKFDPLAPKTQRRPCLAGCSKVNR